MTDSKNDRTREVYPDEYHEQKHDRAHIKDLEKEILMQKRVIGSLVRQLAAVGQPAVVKNEEMHSAPLKVVTDSSKDGHSVVMRLAPRG